MLQIAIFSYCHAPTCADASLDASKMSFLLKYD